MALSYARVTSSGPEGRDVWGKTRVEIFDVTPAASDYATGGYAITAAQVGMRQITGVLKIGGNAAAGQVMPHWDTVNGKLKIYFPSGGAGTSPTTMANGAIAAGATPVTSAAANGSSDLVPGVGVEVGNTADLSSHVYRLMFIGN